MGYIKYFMPETKGGSREMERQYIGFYKCRLCGKVFICGKTYTEDESIKKIVKSCTIFPLFPHDKGYTTHGCKDGSLGIADLQGFKKVSE